MKRAPFSSDPMMTRDNSETATPRRIRFSAQAKCDWGLWWRWVMANAIGEVIGLGAVAAVGVSLVLTLATTRGVTARLVMAGVMILAGTFEGVVIGVAQWWVLRRSLRQLNWRAWMLATVIGAFVAWTLGMIPSTLIGATEAAATPPPEISHALRYALAALMGAVLGPLLGLPQWWVLRRYVPQAAWWVLANTAAWAVGMPVVFVGASLLRPGGFSMSLVVIAIAALASTGAVVGAIHGTVLVWLLRSRQL
jgi:hypothetical protein